MVIDHSSFWVLDLTTLAWCKSLATCPPMRGGVNAVCTVPVRNHAAADRRGVPERVYLSGGMNSEEGTSSIEFLDLKVEVRSNCL